MSDFLDFRGYSGKLKRELKHAGARISRLAESKILEINELKFYIETREDLYILHEIFVNGIYNFKTPGSWMVIDIGSHVGFASLYFAAQKDVVRVHSFEPFRGTVKQAEKNLELNPSIASKISNSPFGLWSEDKQASYAYNYRWKGSSGFYGLTSKMRRDGKTEMVNVELKDAAQEIAPLLEACGKEKVLIKMDCEGAEFEILPRLEAAGLLKEVDVIIIEWHEIGSDKLSQILTRAGFSTFTQKPLAGNNGLIYAFHLR